jgi:kanamycin kinase
MISPATCAYADRVTSMTSVASWQRSRIMTKLNARDRAQLVVLAYECGLVTPGQRGDQLTRLRIGFGRSAGRCRAPTTIPAGVQAVAAGRMTNALPGRNAVEPRWLAQPQTAVRAIGEGLRAMHDALPADSCPFSWTAELRVDRSLRSAAAGRIDPAQAWQPEHHHLSVPQALELIADIPPADQIVVCHGDACAPNTLLTDDGRWSGHVDLGALGVAGRWADIAVATWSTEWNYGPGWQDELLDAYGIKPDPDRTRYYRLLWDLDG